MLSHVNLELSSEAERHPMSMGSITIHSFLGNTDWRRGHPVMLAWKMVPKGSSFACTSTHFLYSFGYGCNILKKIVIKKFARDRMSSLVKRNEQGLVGHTNILLTEDRKEKFGIINS